MLKNLLKCFLHRKKKNDTKTKMGNKMKRGSSDGQDRKILKVIKNIRGQQK